MYLEWFIKSIESKYDDEILGITNSKNIIAFASLKKISLQKCSIGLFGVNPKYFFNGFGRNMLEYIIFYAKKNSYKNLIVKTQGRNIAAKKLYSSSGFQLKSRKTTMHLWLDPS